MDTEIPLGAQDRDSFRGLRSAVLKSKDNDLVWIKDWATYHVAVHGLEGLVLFDNGSQRYSVDELHDALSEVRGLKAVRILSADFPFGPMADGPNAHEAKFLQGGLVEIARLRYLQCAASVLLVDIDELVSPVPQSSIFELAERSLFGYLSIPGRWQFPGDKPGGAMRHRDHIYVARTDIPCRPKYCIVPQGRLGNSFWDVHAPGFGRSRVLLRCRNILRRALRPMLVTHNARFWHCRKITTHWKYDRAIPPAQLLERDQASEAVLSKVFEAPGSEP